MSRWPAGHGAQHGHVAALGIPGEEELPVVGHVGLAAPGAGGGQKVDGGSSGWRRQQVGVGRALGGAKPHVVGRQHDVTQRRQHHRHLRRHGVVAGGLGVLEDGAVLVAQHRAFGAGRLLRHADEARGAHLFAIGIGGQVFKPVRGDGVARHHVFGQRFFGGQRGSNVNGGDGAQQGGRVELPGARGHSGRRWRVANVGGVFGTTTAAGSQCGSQGQHAGAAGSRRDQRGQHGRNPCKLISG